MNTNTGVNTNSGVAAALRLAIAGMLAASGYIHAQLYLDGYRFIPVVGDLFLLQASVSFAVAALILFAAPVLLRVAAAGVALGALAGFTASRTIGVFGFTEHGLQPAPQAVRSILVEAATLLLLAAWQVAAIRQRRGARPQEDALHRGSPAPQRYLRPSGPGPHRLRSTRRDQ